MRSLSAVFPRNWWENHKELNALAKELDPTRLTTIAHVSMTPVESPMHHITDVESYNHYFGWYGGKMEDNGPWLDNFHKVHRISVWDFPSTAAKVLLLTTDPTLPARITAKNIRRCTTSIWRKSWTSVHGSGQATYGICSISAVQPEMKAA